jgi:2'-5' RNA ligase
MTPTFPLRSGFLALPLEGEAKRQFQQWQAKLQFLGDIVSFQKSDVPHLTLSYWPEIMAIEYSQILTQSAKIAGQLRPFTFSVNGCDTFGKPGRDDVLFLSVAFSPELAVAKKKCPWPELYSPFHPHITLLRIKHQEKFQLQKKAVLKALKGVAFDVPVDRLRLFANVDGVSQVPLQDFPFGA